MPSVNRSANAHCGGLSVALVCLCLAAFGCSQETTGPGGGGNGNGQNPTADADARGSRPGDGGRPDGTGATDGGPADAGTDGGDAGDTGPTCPNGTVCGGICCSGNRTCVDGDCLPACSGTRCGPNQRKCCTGTDLCIGGGCCTPSGSCKRTQDCDIGEICQPSLGKCLPRTCVNVCQYKPPTGEFNPVRDCRWQPSKNDDRPGRDDVEAAPVVANMTDDNGDGKTDTRDIPDVVFLSDNHDRRGCCSNPSTIRIVDGRCNEDGSMNTLGSISKPVPESSGGIAVGDLTGDGVPEIVAPGRFRGSSQGTIAWTRKKPDGSEWKLLWKNRQYPKRGVHTQDGAVVSLADLEADGKPEVIIGNVALNGQSGALKWDGMKTTNGKGGVGNNAFLGPASAVADVDLDGNREVAAGNTLYDHDGTPLWTYNYQSRNSRCGGSLDCDGMNGFGDFDSDPEGEVVIVRLGIVYIVNHDGSLHWKQKILKDDCRENEAGPPTVADFDGDGQPEIGTAAADYYTVLDEECDASPVPQKCRQKGILWATPNEDCSSRVTASSVFDFEGDGRAEMVYADEENFYIMDGKTGKILHKDPKHGSNTRIEMPVVADVDNDGNSEVVVPAPYGSKDGISIWADKEDNWVRTRRIWNQHAYSVTNIREDGTLPTQPNPNWRNKRLNNFRQNQQPAGVFDAPDLQIADMSVEGTQCVGSSTVAIIGELSMWFIVGVAVLAALSVANIRYLERFLAGMTGLLPKLFIAAIVLIVGVVVADKTALVISERLKGVKVPQVGVLPSLVKYTVVYVAALIALGQVGVVTSALL
ncbi:MAG: hypothetical protein ABEL76_06825, partial [Bradymonadaceae bacterium]